LGKLDRGADTDYNDLVFLIHSLRVEMNELEGMLRDAIQHARKFDLNPDILEHLQELKDRLE